MTIPDIEMWSSRLVEDEDGAPLPESAQVAFAQAVCDVVEDLRSTNAGDERDGVWEEGYADACHDILAALAGTQADASVTSLPCPTCQGRSRETVGMVCQTCGRDYGAGTQNDDGAVSDDSATAENRPLPAPSSPDRIEAVARAMHDAYEVAARREGWETNPASRVEWADLPPANKATMLTAVGAAVAALDAYDREHDVIRVPLAGATLRTVPEWEADLRERIATFVRTECVAERHTLGTHTCATCERIATRTVQGGQS